jgi:uncharacterized protein (TIGR00251 family)
MHESKTAGGGRRAATLPGDGAPRPITPGENPPGFLTIQPDGVSLAIKVQPRAPANEIGAPLGDELRVKVTAPPVDAAANEALLRLLAETLDCPRGRVELIRGHTSRHKIVKVYGVPVAVVLAKLARR